VDAVHALKGAGSMMHVTIGVQRHMHYGVGAPLNENSVALSSTTVAPSPYPLVDSDVPVFSSRNTILLKTKRAAKGKFVVVEASVEGSVSRQFINRSDLFVYVRRMVSGLTKQASSYMPQLSARDLRRLDFSLVPFVEPSLIVREHVALLLIDPVRAVIMADRCILLSADSCPDNVTAEIESNLRQLFATQQTDRAPFEYECIEVLVQFLMKSLRVEYEEMLPNIEKLLHKITGRRHPPSSKLPHIRDLKDRLSQLYQKSQGVHAAVARVLEDEQDLFALQLTRLQSDESLVKEADFDNHDEAEVFLQSLLLPISPMVTQQRQVLQQIVDAEQLLQLRLNNDSNRIWTAELLMNLFVLFCNFIGAVGSAFGLFSVMKDVF
jgi:hypothetical protein